MILMQEKEHWKREKKKKKIHDWEKEEKKNTHVQKSYASLYQARGATTYPRHKKVVLKCHWS